MNLNHITIITRIDKCIFRAFSHFNAFRLHNRWLGLAIFPILMITLGVINQKTGSSFLFYLFSIIGLALPILYLWFYFVSLSHQVNANQLETAQEAYTVTLTKQGVEVKKGQEHARYPWKQVYRVYVLHDTAYIYITKGRAFLVPFSGIQGDVMVDDLVSFIKVHLAEIRLFDKRGRVKVHG